MVELTPVVGLRREREVLTVALATGRHVVLEGPPGTGKTTLLRSIAADTGQEVVFVGGFQAPEQLVRALIAEDAATLMVDGDAGSLARIAELCTELGAGDVVVTPLDVRPGAPRSP